MELAKKPGQTLVLVVDDEPFMRRTIREALEPFGFEVAEAVDGRQALELIPRLSPDVVLLDVIMPHLDGFETCAALRRLPEGAHLPVVMLTALDDNASILRAYEVGATDFASKPLNYSVLGHRLRYILRANAAFAGLHRSQARLAEAQRIARLGGWEWDPKGERFRLSAEAAQILGLGTDEVCLSEKELLQGLLPADRPVLAEALEAMLREGIPFGVDCGLLLPGRELRHLRAQGTTACDLPEATTRIFGTIQDITEHKQAEERMHFLAYYDPLTALPNRLLFNERLTYILAHARRYKTRVALLYLDLDRFKTINESLGHSAGDRLLREVSRRILATLRVTDVVARQTAEEFPETLARLGGDEFSLWLPEVDEVQDVVKVARRIMEIFERPFEVAGQELFVSASIGIALFPDDGGDMEVLLKNADTALSHAKRMGRKNYQFYSRPMNAAAVQMLEMGNHLHRAVERGELLLYYQPQIDLRSGEIFGAEALLRWRHGGKDLVLPGEFIPLAEESGLIISMGEWALRSACLQARAWEEEGHPLRVSVNLSSRQFWHRDLAPMVARILAETALPPHLLHLEITETILLESGPATLETLMALKDLGAVLSLDDFGTGYSSLSYLRRYPFAMLKIDQAFTREIEGDAGAGMVEAIMAMARSLKLQVIAEGVENAAQLDALRSRGCDIIQGFLVSPPLAAEEFGTFLRRAAFAGEKPLPPGTGWLAEGAI
ncbi:diguanylate cyclase [Desulfuromonas soudanensis]|uniref:Diguanylate cyclase n=1 Tax=Desulfuromonas soudanensis TaxID=1603606 RepID=A0A0M4DC34_9BACT|nr:EAL domain-containing protein [Desulfuromonas soudanensis]ALC18030.1 diguanylate cyclase [Desulfuromonas soudanensis]